jgi:hypothetical protein
LQPAKAKLFSLRLQFLGQETDACFQPNLNLTFKKW